MYTIKEGQFVRTLTPHGCTGKTIEITYIALSYQGKIYEEIFKSLSKFVNKYYNKHIELVEVKKEA